MIATVTITRNSEILETFQCPVDTMEWGFHLRFPHDIVCEEGDSVSISYEWEHS